MAILQGDVKLVETQVMLDVSEGGGAPTSRVVIDGVSNAVFPDISELDRAIGRVNLRKLAVHIDTANVDDYLGANVIVAEPPNDPNVAITLFSTGETFDERTSAVSRMEAYLSIGPQYAGYLYGNHVQGQDTLLIFQKSSETPPIGGTLVLTKREGYGDQHRQYVRVIEASSVLVQFEDDKGPFTRYVMTLRLSSQLDADFTGFDVKREEYTKEQLALATKVSDSVVANAARYYGVSPTQEPAVIGDFSIKAGSMFTQLVPSAQIETPIADARTNQLQAGVVAAGGVVTRTLTAVFNATQSLFVGGGIAPGTLSVVNGTVTVTDAGGRLMSAGSQVGIVDYENGVLDLTANVFGTGSLSYTITYAPAAAPVAVNQSQGIDVTAENRALSWVRTIEPAPVRGTFTLSYMAAGRWYVLREQGDGAIRGAESGYGAGSMNFTTGTWSVTLGALPDVGSAIVATWVQPDAAVTSDTVLTLDAAGRFYWPFNTAGAVSGAAGPKTITPGALSISWTDGASTRTVTDNSAGALTGYGTGSVNYANGSFKLSPTTLPAVGTQINVTLTSATPTASASVAVTSGAGNLGATNIRPGSVSMSVTVQKKAAWTLTGGSVVNVGVPTPYLVTDDAAGGLRIRVGNTDVACGSINYTTGAFSMTANLSLNAPQATEAVAFDNLYLLKSTLAWSLRTV